MNNHYYEKMNKLIKVMEKKNEEFNHIINDLKKPGIIDILDKEFNILITKIEKSTSNETKRIFHVIEPIIHRKMVTKKKYNKEAVEKIIQIFKLKLIDVAKNKIKISFNEVLSSAIEEYNERIEKLKELKSKKITKINKYKNNIVSVGEMFVAGGFIATDYHLISDTNFDDEKIVAALLGTIFAGGIYFLKGTKDIQI